VLCPTTASANAATTSRDRGKLPLKAMESFSIVAGVTLEADGVNFSFRVRR
jgi:hypothetical protein